MRVAMKERGVNQNLFFITLINERKLNKSSLANRCVLEAKAIDSGGVEIDYLCQS